MNGKLLTRAAMIWVTAAAPALALVGCGEDPPEEAPAVQEFEFAGTVQSVDSTRRMVTVENEDIPGWMSPMAMPYQLSPAGILDSLQTGDRISATVRSGDFSTLYDVEIVRP